MPSPHPIARGYRFGGGGLRFGSKFAHARLIASVSSCPPNASLDETPASTARKSSRRFASLSSRTKYLSPSAFCRAMHGSLTAGEQGTMFKAVNTFTMYIKWV
jgi:hypothetical protein